MTSQDVERRLTEVLHRHAEVAMSRTDTQRELREFLTRGAPEPAHATGRRFIALATAGTAAAAAAAAVFWAADLTQDRADPAPSTNLGPNAAEIATEFVTAYASNDLASVEAFAAEDADLGTWRTMMARNEAWGVHFLFEPCRQVTTVDVGTGVLCPFALHVLGSEDLGRGPFENAHFTVWVNKDGEVFDADPTWNFERNGMDQHVGAVVDWVLRAHPDEKAFLELEEQDVPPDQFDRWAGLWREYVADYVEEHRKG